MNINDYQQDAMRTCCPMDKVKDRIEYEREWQLLHSVLGLMGEVGELAGALEKWLFYGKPLDTVNVGEEFGDASWYLAEGADAIRMQLSDILERNISKLRKRYPEKFSEEKAAEENRDRAGERAILEQTGARVFKRPQAEVDTVEIPVAKAGCCEVGECACEGGPMAQPSSKNYQALCGKCEIIRLSKRNQSGVCPDCAADIRSENAAKRKKGEGFNE